MGSKKSIERTDAIELMVPVLLYDSFFKIRTGLNQLEAILAADFPEVNSETAIPHKNLQEALFRYYERLTEGVSNQKLNQSGIAAEHPYARAVPNFVKFLESHGKVGISAETEVKSEKDANGEHIDLGERVAVFLDEKPIGSLDFFQKPLEFSYDGIVPGVYYSCEIYNLGVPPGFTYVRLICCNPGTEKQAREDNWKIPFP